MQLLSFTILAVLFNSTLAASKKKTPALGPTVVGIDFGSQFVKASYVAPGEAELIPMVLNDMSERKTQNAVAFREGVPFVGPHAAKPLINQAETGYIWLNDMLGQTFDSSEVQQHLKHTAALFKKDISHGGVIAFNGHSLVKSNPDNDDDAPKSESEPESKEIWTPVEYLSAMLLERLAVQTEECSRRILKNAVITVPAHWSQAQRIALLDVAKIAGINVLSITTDVATCALYYGVISAGSLKDERYVVILDSGATHTSVGLVHVHPGHTENSPGKRPATLVHLQKTLSTTELGGLEIDRRIAAELAKRFEESTGKPVPLGKAMNRLLVEAGRVKQILTANTSIEARVDELVDDLSLKTTFTRENLEDLCASMRGIASDLIKRMLGDFPLEKVAAIIPIGGNARVPFVQADLQTIFGSHVQYTLNMDETIAQGAALYAATLTPFIKVKPVVFRDSSAHSFALTYSSSSAKSNDNIIELYPSGSSLGGHKSVTFKTFEEPHFEAKIVQRQSLMVSETSTSIEEHESPILSVKISGFDAAINKFKESNPLATVISSKLKFWVDLDNSGIVQVIDTPVLIVEYQTTENETKLNSDDLKETLEKAPEAPQDEIKKEEDKKEVSEKDEKESSNIDEEKNRKESIRVETISLPLNLDVKKLFSHLSSNIVQDLHGRILEAKAEERRVKAKAAVRNDLEVLMYRLKDLTDEDETQNGFIEYATNEDLEAIKKAIEESSNFLMRDDNLMTMDDLRKNHQNLMISEGPVNRRASDYKDRPEMIKKLRKQISSITEFVARVRSDSPDPATRPQTDADLEGLVKTANETLAWLNPLVIQQETLPTNQEPVLSSVDIKVKTFSLSHALDAIVNKRIPKTVEPNEAKKTGENSDSKPTNENTQSESKETPAPDSEPKNAETEPSLTHEDSYEKNQTASREGEQFFEEEEKMDL